MGLWDNRRLFGMGTQWVSGTIEGYLAWVLSGSLGQ